MHYTYDFNYSMQVDSFPKQVSPANDQEREFMEAAKEFADSEIVMVRDVSEFVKLLVRQKIFNKIGNMIFNMGEIKL